MGLAVSQRPILGSLTVVVAGGVIAIVPIQFGNLLALVGFQNTTVGLFIGGGIVLCGIAAFLWPSFSRELGIVTLALSVLSLFGALGGLVVGLVLGIIGGNMLMAWKTSA